MKNLFDTQIINIKNRTQKMFNELGSSVCTDRLGYKYYWNRISSKQIPKKCGNCSDCVNQDLNQNDYYLM